MRLINGDALYRKVKRECNPYGKPTIDFESGNRVLDLIDSQPTIHPEPHWIPVTERLPEKSGEYLVTVKWVTGDCDVDVYEYDARHKTWNDGESAGGERAVAWCERPEPYKGVTT